MEIVTDRTDLAGTLAGRDRPVGLVPTMGALHAGHLSLLERAREECSTVVVSVFVNPLQFGSDEDLATYPRDLEADAGVLERHGADVVFAPGPEFAPAEVTRRAGDVGAPLEGASRPGHFDGVVTIVGELLDAVAPDRAYFGEKDFQQLAVVRAMVAAEGRDTAVVACPLVRDKDGLALSSRNVRLTPGQRTAALQISATLLAVQGAWDGDADTARVRLRRRLEDARGVQLDYAEIVDPVTFSPLEGETTVPARALVAAWVGGVRLIDNVALPAAR